MEISRTTILSILLLMTALASSACSDDASPPVTTDCPVGTDGCECDEGACEAGLTCDRGYCVAATENNTVNNTTNNNDTCEQGTTDCPCFDNGTCFADNLCDSADTCRSCPDGSEGCNCEDGTSCDAGLSCNDEGLCEAEANNGGTNNQECDPTTCDDDNPCTDEVCDDAGACVNVNNTAACDDGSACTDNDICADGVCGGEDLDCDDGVSCTNDSCDDATGCVNEADDAQCDDGVSCTTDSCDATNDCQFAPDDTLCDDGVACTDDVCDALAGCGFSANDANCDDGVSCTDDTCDAANDCQYVADDANCDDGVSCTTDSCNAANDCQYAPDDTVCDDGVACTNDTCDAANDCQFAPDDTLCADTNPCTTNEICDTTLGCTMENEADGALCGVDAGCVDNMTCLAKGVSALTCDDLGWPVGNGSAEVCAESEIPQGDGTRACLQNMTQPETLAVCDGIGARLCTIAELQNDESRGTGCGWDDDLIWSSTPCVTSGGEDGFLAQAGSTNNLNTDPRTCLLPTSTSPKVRCCADATLDPNPSECTFTASLDNTCTGAESVECTSDAGYCNTEGACQRGASTNFITCDDGDETTAVDQCVDGACLGCLSDIFDPGDDSASGATALEPNTRVTGRSLCPNGDRDYFTVPVPQGWALGIDVDNGYNYCVNSTVDLSMQLGADQLNDDNAGVDDCPRMGPTLDGQLNNMDESTYTFWMRDETRYRGNLYDVETFLFAPYGGGIDGINDATAVDGPYYYGTFALDQDAIDACEMDAILGGGVCEAIDAADSCVMACVGDGGDEATCVPSCMDVCYDELDATYNACIEATADEHWYTLTLDEPSSLAIATGVMSCQGDTRLALFAEDGVTLIAENDNTPMWIHNNPGVTNGLCAQLLAPETINLPAGTYQVRVSSNTASIYELAFTLGDFDVAAEAEPNDSIAEAQVIGPNTVMVEANLEEGGSDWYVVNITETRRLTITTGNGDCTTDTRIELWERGGRTFTSAVDDDNISGGICSRLLLNADPGEYIIRVLADTDGGPGETSGPYTLYIDTVFD